MFDISEELKKLPSKPGVYLMKNDSGQIIYVGKAINLRNRVRSYFRDSNQDIKVMSMRANIAEFEYIVTDNELESLILENNLIKKHCPKYNIKLKDNKTYPYIKVTVNEPYPRVIFTREHTKDKARYFGPYSSAFAVRETINTVHRIWPLRSCAKVFPRDVNKERPCLNHHLGKCLAPCCGQVSEEDYNKIADEAIQFLSGKYPGILKTFEERMEKFAEALEFEQAAEIRDKIQAIKKATEKQKIDQGFDDQDVAAFARAGDEALVYIFFVRGGKMTGSEHVMLSGAEEVTDSEIMTEFIKRFYSETSFVPRDIVTETEINERELITEWLSSLKGRRVNIITPRRAERMRLVELARKNAELTLEQFGEKIKREAERTVGALCEIAAALGIETYPERIEAVDISNIQGFESVGSMVVFEEGKPKRNDYRKFKIKAVIGPNDYAAMEEVLYRRFTRYKNELTEPGEGKFSKLPDMLFVDGGRAQVGVALKVLSDLELTVPVCGMVKDDNHRTRALYYNDREVVLPRTSEGFKLVTRIQDEVHRFAIEYHRKLREKSQVKSVLDDIPGIGDIRRKALLKHFGDIERIRTAEVAELNAAAGMNARAAEAVYIFFHGGLEKK